MQMKRFVAADMRRALQLVKDNLGPEAIILTNKKIPQGVEVVASAAQQPLPTPEPKNATLDAMRSDAIAADSPSLLANDPLMAQRRQFEPENLGSEPAANKEPQSVEPVPVLSDSAKARFRAEAERARERMFASKRKHEQSGNLLADSLADSWPASTAGSAPGLDLNASQPSQSQIDSLHQELQDLRTVLEKQLRQVSSDTASFTPLQSRVADRLHSLGFSAQLCAKFVAEIGSEIPASKAWHYGLANAAKELRVRKRDLCADGGVFALVGATGAGKTTTIAKLAVRYMLKHGADQLALVTTDVFRMGAHEQLRTLAKILGVPLKVVTSGAEMARALHQLRHKGLVLVDTAGFRPGDPQLQSQMNLLSQQKRLQTLLVLAANGQRQLSLAAMNAYGEESLAGVILTKIDETLSLGETLETVVQRAIPLAYTTDGQNIPEDIDVASAAGLIAKAVSLAEEPENVNMARNGIGG